jgi:hypothetical protein
MPWRRTGSGSLVTVHGILIFKDQFTPVLGPDDDEEVTEEDATVASPYNGLLPSSQIIALNTVAYGIIPSSIPNYNVQSEAEPITMVEGEIVDCKVSRWSRWSKCRDPCGYKTRSRSIEVSYIITYIWWYVINVLFWMVYANLMWDELILYVYHVSHDEDNPWNVSNF